MTQPAPAYAFPGPIPREALEYLRAKGLTPSFSWEDVWAEEHVSAFTVAKGMQLDVLSDIKAALDRALAEGATLETFRRELAPLLQAKGWWGRQQVVDPATGETVTAQLGSPRRLRTIYAANLRAARAVGQWQRIQETKESLPYLMYMLGPSLHHRPEHVAWAGTCLPVNDPWWEAHMPPKEYGCKCWVRQVSPSEYASLAGREGAQLVAPPDMMVRWTNSRTGEIVTVPAGVNPAWAGNPGATRQDNLRKELAAKQARFDALYPQK